MNAYLQRTMQNEMNYQTMRYGLDRLGYIIYDLENAWNFGHADTTVVYGNVSFVVEVTKNWGYNIPKLGYVPVPLRKHAGREIVTMELADALAYIRETGPKFLKPVEANQKFFTGKVIKSLPDLDVMGYPSDADVYVSEPVNILAEYRGFVLNNELVALRHYKGDFRLYPKCDQIDKMIKDWKDQPAAWSCDVGVFDDGETYIIEVNDVMSLGLYGVEPIIAGRMLIERWAQIHKQYGKQFS